MEIGADYETFVHWDLVPADLRGVLLNVTWDNAEP
jgi:hypothetical protein